jgi:hypothetical protein
MRHLEGERRPAGDGQGIAGTSAPRASFVNEVKGDAGNVSLG